MCWPTCNRLHTRCTPISRSKVAPSWPIRSPPPSATAASPARPRPIPLPDAATGLRVDVGAGVVSGTADLDATGADASAWLPSCLGSVAVQISGAHISGLDFPRVTRLVAAHRLSPKPLTAALTAGTSPDIDGTLSGTIDHGRLTLGQATLTSPAGTLTLSGTLMLDRSASDIGIDVTPDAPAPPPIHLHLAGPWTDSRLQTDIGRPPRQRPPRRTASAPRQK